MFIPKKISQSKKVIIYSFVGCVLLTIVSLILFGGSLFAVKIKNKPSLTLEEQALMAPSNSIRKIRSLFRGVNGGPNPFLPNVYKNFIDTTKQFQSLGVDAIRLHDYFGPNDIMCMFPDPSANPSDDSNYKFEETDTVFQSVVDGNFRPMLRLGQSWKAGQKITGYDQDSAKSTNNKNVFFPSKPKSYPKPGPSVIFTGEARTVTINSNTNSTVVTASNIPALPGSNFLVVTSGQACGTWSQITKSSSESLTLDASIYGFTSKDLFEIKPGYEFWSEGFAAGLKKSGPEMWKHIVSRYSDSGRWGKNALKDGWIEIWNEPNFLNTTLNWDASPEEFYEFYATTAKALIIAFPELKFGGPGLSLESTTTSQGRKWVEDFLKYMRTHNVPLHFFSWHAYSANIEVLRGSYFFYENLLKKYGYADVPQIMTEYNTDAITGAGAGQMSRPHGFAAGGALLTTAWIEMQSWPNLEGLFFYRGADGPFVPNSYFTIQVKNNSDNSLGDSGMGLLYGDGTLKPQGGAFSLYNKLVGMELIDLAEPSLFVTAVGNVNSINTDSLANSSAKLAGGLPVLGVLAGREPGKVRLLIVNPQNVTVNVLIADLLRTGQIEPKSTNTQVTIISLSVTNTPYFVGACSGNNISTTRPVASFIATNKSFNTLTNTNGVTLQPYSVQVYEFSPK